MTRVSLKCRLLGDNGADAYRSQLLTEPIACVAGGHPKSHWKITQRYPVRKTTTSTLPTMVARHSASARSCPAKWRLEGRALASTAALL